VDREGDPPDPNRLSCLKLLVLVKQIKPRILVAAGLIRRDDDDCFLVTRRGAHTHLAHSWEFPGGKVDPGEAPSHTVQREIREELGVEVEVGDIYAVGHHEYDTKEVILMVYEAKLMHGEPQCLEVADLKWVTPYELMAMTLPPADEPVIARLRREYQ
jgi:8-oxo-dGTP diphosphatase